MIKITYFTSLSLKSQFIEETLKDGNFLTLKVFFSSTFRVSVNMAARTFRRGTGFASRIEISGESPCPYLYM